MERGAGDSSRLNADFGFVAVADMLPGIGRVVTGIPTPSRWPEVRAAAVEQIIELCRSLAPIVVLDYGFGIEAELTISAPGVARDLLQNLVEQAHIVCPYSNATRGNIDVRLHIDTAAA